MGQLIGASKQGSRDVEIAQFGSIQGEKSNKVPGLGTAEGFKKSRRRMEGALENSPRLITLFSSTLLQFHY